MRCDNMLLWDYNIVIEIECMWLVEYVLNCEITRVLRCYVHRVVSYEPYNHTTVRPFKGDELMYDEYCDESTVGTRQVESLWGVMS